MGESRAATRDASPRALATQRIFFLRNHLLDHAVRSPSESSRLPDALVSDSHAFRDAALTAAHTRVGGHVRESLAVGQWELSVGTRRRDWRAGDRGRSTRAALPQGQNGAPGP